MLCLFFFGKFVIDSRLSFGSLPSVALIALSCYKMKTKKKSERIKRLASYRHSMSWHRWIVILWMKMVYALLQPIYLNLAEHISKADVKAKAKVIANNNINFNRGKWLFIKIIARNLRVTGSAVLLSCSHICHYYFSCCSLCCLKFSFLFVWFVCFLLFHKSSFVSLLMPFTRFPLCIEFLTLTKPTTKTTTASSMPIKPNDFQLPLIIKNYQTTNYITSKMAELMANRHKYAYIHTNIGHWAYNR